MRFARHDFNSIVLGLLVLLSVIASHPNGGGRQLDNYMMQQLQDSEVCTDLGRYIDVLLSSTRGHCDRFPRGIKDMEACSSSSSGINTILECVEGHNKAEEASECLVNILERNSTSITSAALIDYSCLCLSMSESFMALYSSGQLFCGKTYLDDLIIKHRDSRFLGSLLAGLGGLATSVAPAVLGGLGSLGSLATSVAPAVLGGVTSLVPAAIDTITSIFGGDDDDDDEGFFSRWGFLNEHQHANPNPEVCTSLRRYMDILLRSMEGQCENFPKEGEDMEACISNSPGVNIIKKCAEGHNKTSEASECLVNFLEGGSNSSPSLSPSCLCHCMAESFLGLFSAGQLFCTKTFLDDIVNDHRESRFWSTILRSVVRVAPKVLPAVLPMAVEAITSLFSDGDREENQYIPVNHQRCLDHPHFFISDFLEGEGAIRGIIDIPKNDQTFYQDKSFKIIHTFNDTMVGDLHYELNLPINQRIFPMKMDDQGRVWETEQATFDEVPDLGKVAWSLHIPNNPKVKIPMTVRVEVNGNLLCKEGQ